MTADLELMYFLLPFLVGFGAISIFFRQCLKKELHKLKRSIQLIQVNLVGLGIILTILWFGLQLVPISRIPGALADGRSIQSLDDVIQSLQEQNRAIARTVIALEWFLFLFTWSFLTVLFDFLKAMSVVMAQGSEYTPGGID